MRIIFIAICVTISLQAEILDAKQLFNKRVVEAQLVDLAKQKTYYAEIQEDESKTVDIVLRFDGFVQELFADTTFEYVKKGEKLFSIYSEAVVNSQEEYIFAKNNNQRQSIIDSTFNKLKALGVDKKNLQEIYKSQKLKENVDVYAPIDGFVSIKNINRGSFAKRGQLLMQIKDLSTLWVIAKVYQEDLNFLKLGMDAEVKIDGVGKVLGKVDFIYPNVNNTTKTVDVRVVIENKELTIFPNTFAKVALREKTKEMLVLPKTAVLTKGEKHYVFKPTGDSYEPVEVSAQRLNSKTYQILSGISSGTKVIDRVLFMLDSDAVTNGLYDVGSDDWEDSDW